MAAARKQISSSEGSNPQKSPLQRGSLSVVQRRPQPKTATDVKVITHLRDMLKKPEEGGSAAKAVPDLTYGHAVLMNVVYEKYDRALESLDQIKELEKSYPEFGVAASRYIKHAKSLVRALKAKRAVGKLPQISRAKQKELVSTLGTHFADLKACVVNIEKAERQSRRVDLASTSLLLLAVYWACAAIFFAALLIYALPLYTFAIHSVVTDVISAVVIWIVNFIWPY